MELCAEAGWDCTQNSHVLPLVTCFEVRRLGKGPLLGPVACPLRLELLGEEPKLVALGQLVDGT